MPCLSQLRVSICNWLTEWAIGSKYVQQAYSVTFKPRFPLLRWYNIFSVERLNDLCSAWPIRRLRNPATLDKRFKPIHIWLAPARLIKAPRLIALRIYFCAHQSFSIGEIIRHIIMWFLSFD